MYHHLTMATPLATVLVSSSTFGFLGGIFTRDAPLVFGVYYAFWAVIALTYYIPAAAVNDVFFYVPFIVAVAASTAIAVVKLLNIGQLIDVWVTGSGGGDNYRASRYEELNLPLMPVAIVFAFFAVFFGVAAASCGSDSTTCANFLNGIWAVSSWTVGWLLFGVFAALTLLAVFASGIQVKRGGRHKTVHDYASVLYTFIFLVVTATPALVWHLSGLSIITNGWVSGGVAVVVDALFLGAGTVYEKWRDEGKDEVGKTGSGRSSRNGRFYSIEGSTTRLFFRFALVSLIHGFAYVLGGYALDATAMDVGATFWPWMIAYFGGLFFLIGGIYVIVVLFFQWQDFYFGSPSSSPSSDEEALLARKPNSSPTATAMVESAIVQPVASRTRRRIQSNDDVPKKSYSFD